MVGNTFAVKISENREELERIGGEGGGNEKRKERGPLETTVSA